MNERALTDDHFDLCIIGSGSGLSLIDDDISDWKIALIDKGTGPTEAFGGTCLNAGCIPTKMLAMPASYALAPEYASRVGVGLDLASVDFKAIQSRTFNRTDSISVSGLAGLGKRDNVEVFFGAATFVDEHTVRVGRREITADRIVIAAGSRPRPITAPGFDDAYLQAFVHTSQSIMRVEELPHRLVILGGGIEAVEFGHIFAGMESQVSIISRSEPLLRAYDSAIGQQVTEELSERAVVRLNQNVTGLDSDDFGGVVLTTEDSLGIEYSYAADAVLVCLGRIPNGDQLHLDAAGISLDKHGFIPVDDHMRTSADHIWALGDICSPMMLKHLANAQARVVKRNLLAERDGTALVSCDERFVPQGIFTEPQVACVGASEEQLVRSKVDYISHIQRYDSVVYGWAVNDSGHFVKLLADPAGEHLLGAHIVGEQATTLIQPLVQAMSLGQTISEIALHQYWIHPALTEVVENALLGILSKANK